MNVSHVSLGGAILLLLMSARPAVTQPPSDCLPLEAVGPQGAALLPGGLMNVRHAGSASQPLSLDVYPHADGAVRPLAVVLRGGSGTVGQRSSYVGQLVEAFGDAGYVVATSDYRSSSVRAAADDVSRALRLLTQCHAASLHIDPYKVVLVAEDSAAPVALHAGSALLQRRLGRSAAGPPAPAAMVIAGGRFVGAVPAAVPTLVVHGAADTEVPVAEARALCAGPGATCEVLEVAGASHRVENWWPSQWAYKAAVLRSLRAHVGAVPPPRHRASRHADLRKRVTFDATHGLTLDASVPAGAGPHPAVVLVHGGGWEAGDRVTYVAPMFAVAAARGLAWLSIDYRLTPAVTVREQVQDVATALDYIRAHAGELRIDPARLVLVGESASGQLVAHVAASQPALAGVVSFYGVYDLVAMAGDPADPRSLARRLFRLTTTTDEGNEALRVFSPQHRIPARLPPMLLIAGTADRLVAQQRAYAAALRRAGHIVEAVEVDGAPHGMESWHEQPGWRMWEQRVGEWLRTRLVR